MTVVKLIADSGATKTEWCLTWERKEEEQSLPRESALIF